jgi:plasmid stabilization system protein ParE/ferredoxin
MARIQRRPRASDDIAEIWDYIADDSVAQADAFVDRLDRKLQLLATQPMMGRARDELAPGLRSMAFGRYVVFYEPFVGSIPASRTRISVLDQRLECFGAQGVFLAEGGNPNRRDGAAVVQCRVLRVTLHPSGWPFDAAESQTLLHAALAAGIRLPSSCRNGTCRACRCLALRGAVVHTIEWPGLSREEKAEGWILPCVARATSEVVLHVPDARTIVGSVAQGG